MFVIACVYEMPQNTTDPMEVLYKDMTTSIISLDGQFQFFDIKFCRLVH